MSRKLSIFGATGSIGGSTLDLVERSGESFELVAVTAANNATKLAEIARKFGAKRAVIADERQYNDLRSRLEGSGIEVAAGQAALVEAAHIPCDLHIAAIVGCAGLEPTMAAVEDGRTVALANKESLVTAGSLMTSASTQTYSRYDSVLQCFASATTMASYVEGLRAVGAASAQFAVYFPDMGGSMPIRRVQLDPKKCEGATYRHTAEGWGIVHVNINLRGSIVGSLVSANTEKRANAWVATYPELGSPQQWHWPAVSRHLRRLRRALAAGI